MQIKSVRIRNLRAFEDETILLGPYTCLVGPNGAGKSTVLCALNIFFRETENSSTNLAQLDAEDFHLRNVNDAIEITLTFNDLNEPAQVDFKDYYRHGTLVVTAKAEFDATSGLAVVRQYGNRLVMADFAPYFEGVKAKIGAARLKEIFAALHAKYEDIEHATTMDGMADSLRSFESNNEALCVLLPSEDQFYGASQGGGRLEKYVQWIYVPAVKDASEEQTESKNTALGRLLARTVRAKVNFTERIKQLRENTQQLYRDLVDSEQTALTEISTALQERLAEWAHPDATARLAWHQDSKTSVKLEEPIAKLIAGDGEFEGQIARFGHGMQRSYLLALLQGLLKTDDAEAPKLILGCEEPELYQHPPQARHLAAVLQKLSEGNTQVVLSTHSPVFVDGRGFESVRMVRKQHAQRRSLVKQPLIANVSAKITEVTGSPLLQPEGMRAKLHQVLLPGLNEMFFTSNLVLVEGIEDAAYINSWLVITGRWDDFRRHGCHVVPASNKSEIIQPLVVANELSIPTFIMFDADADKLSHTDPARAAELRRLHERDNKALLSLVGAPGDPFPLMTLWGDNYAVWPLNFAKSLKAEVGLEEWDRFASTAAAEYGSPGSLQKNTLGIGTHLSLMAENGIKPASLEQLCDRLLAFGSR